MESTNSPAISTASAEPAPGCAGVVHGAVDEVARYAVDTDLYSLEALFRACYAFTDRCYLFLRRSGLSEVTVEFRARRPGVFLADEVGAFANELIDQRVRADLRRETAHIRDWIVAQAFIEADLSPDDALFQLRSAEGADEPLSVRAARERV